MSSRFLSPRQIRGLEKAGDAFIPGDETLPSFSRTGCVDHVDEILEYLPESDVDDLSTLLTLFSFLPVFMLRFMHGFLEFAPWLPGVLGAQLRLLRIGLKGLITTLYYSGKTGQGFEGTPVLDLLGYHVDVYTADLKD